ncbi:type VI secretion system baseplate subunit TssG [Epibacterium sp. Ofav1-8]|uniref:type VI secretion system baseplate subunit TssG n=1 Tax=Epibacterium sp. Ofav1-8 TaxID=2917735 RepID=UPI001EF638A6|nr:type VI secretion system baseplate subunit TssG [Epibacterium sp. Ofav1-8]MCG7625020.1 type VI secretion system baseplate subunit TssG [Epibacterium sp. Ofav1-8]
MTGDALPLPAAPRASDTLDRRAQEEQAASGVGLFTLLRELERRAGHKPAIGQNKRLRDAIVHLGQDPALAFPTRDVARVDLSQSTARLRAQFMGLFGAFGALPLNWTEEVESWFAAGDESFVAFCDIFTARFQELFFRAWSDARAISQFDHADSDRFQAYILSLLGCGTPAARAGSRPTDMTRLHLAPLAAGRVKSPVRLRQMLELHFQGRARFSIEEHVPSWLALEPDALCLLGAQGCTLGENAVLGGHVQSLSAKIRIHVMLRELSQYQRFLPGGADHAALQDIVFWYLGQTFDIETALWLPRPQISTAVLGESTQVGWLACIGPVAATDAPAGASALPTHGDHLQVSRYPLLPDPFDTPELKTTAA